VRNFVSRFVSLATLSLASLSFAATLQPTTTISIQTSNNTAAALPATQSNGNVGVTNISKQKLQTLLSTGSTTRVIAVYQPWFRLPYHMEIGYDEHTSAQVQKQVEDAMSRGVTGFAVNWYGQPIDSDKKFMNDVTTVVRQQAETHPGFGLLLQYDGGAIRSWTGDKTQKVIDDLNYAAINYFNSPAYIRKNNRPIVEFFGIDEAGPVDWGRIRAGVQGSPLFLHRNVGGFTHTQSDGAYGWLGITSSWTTAVTYNDQFYKTALTYPTKVVVGPVWTGFNDTLASWSGNRITPRACGQVWLKTWAQAKQYYPQGNVDFLELNTWNDYEEGSELESGVDDCNIITASVAGTALSWTVTGGTASAIDHFEIYATLDGQNAQMLTTAASGTRTIDVAQFNLNPASYQLFVKSIGAPTIVNHMSNSAAYTVANSMTVALNVTPTSGIAPLPVTASATTTLSLGTVASTTINFGDGTTVNSASASHTYTAAGTYTITATSTDSFGVKKSTTSTVTVAANQPPIAALSLSLANGVAPAAVTASTAASSDPDGTVASSSINFGDGTVMSGPSATHTYAAAGTYTVTATVTDDKGGSSTTSASATLSAPNVTVTAPVSGSTMDSPVHFVASSTAPTGRTISTWAVLVDGASAYSGAAATLDANVTVAPGSHSISIQATDSAGSVYTKALSLTVNNKPPTASLALSTASTTTGSAVNASVTASDPDGSIASYSVAFGDGFVATTPTASHAYTAAGTYTVTATATDNNGAKATSSSTVTVTATGIFVSSPAANATLGSSVHFVASVVPAAGQTVTLTRIYVDSVSAYEVAAASVDTSLALASGSHNIVVQAWDTAGTVYRSPFTINVTNQAPTVSLAVSSNSVLTGAIVTATVNAADPDGSIAAYSIDFGDGTVVTSSTGNHAYTAAGTYTVTATATDNAGAKTTSTSSVAVKAPGVYVSSPTPGSTAGSPVHFVASAVAPAGQTITCIRIYLDYVSTYNVTSASLDTYLKMTTGTHNVIVQAWDSAGTVYKSSMNITVK
jgi:PKD repeat protein